MVSRKQHSFSARIGVTLGDPAGIGPEIVVKALSHQKIWQRIPIVLFGDVSALESVFPILKKKIRVETISHPSEYPFPSDGVYLVDSKVLKNSSFAFGKISGLCGQSAYQAILNAIHWAFQGWIDGIATAPIHKESLRLGGCPQIDHTEILKAEVSRIYGSSMENVMTLFLTRTLRIFFLTRHMSLAEVPLAITPELLSKTIPRCLQYLRQLGIRNPSLAVAALNPHGGEGGLFGTEEMEVILPAITQAQKEGYSVKGPIPADSVFYLARKGKFDGVLSLYHDQGHIAAKTLDFHRTVSLTMGLPFLRTSVDHGTAFDIAGKGIADETSMVEAILACAKYAPKIRKAYSQGIL